MGFGSPTARRLWLVVRLPEPTFTQVPNGALTAGLSPHALALYVQFLSFANKTGEAWPKRITLAKRLGFKKADSVDKYINELVEAEFLTVMRRNRTSSVYSVLTVDGVAQTSRESDPIPQIPPTAGIKKPPTAGIKIPPTAGTELYTGNHNQGTKQPSHEGSTSLTVDRPLRKAKSAAGASGYGRSEELDNLGSSTKWDQLNDSQVATLRAHNYTPNADGHFVWNPAVAESRYAQEHAEEIRAERLANLPTWVPPGLRAKAEAKNLDIVALTEKTTREAKYNKVGYLNAMIEKATVSAGGRLWEE